MAGHNKWSKIKRKKAANDAKRAKNWSKILKEITVSVREGGATDPDFNPRLRLAIQNAKGANMPKDNIERAIKKGSEVGGADYQELFYEGYAPGGVAIFIETLTDNINRTVAHIRAIFNKNEGSLATSGSVAFMFERKAVFEILLSPDTPFPELEMIDAGAEEIELDTDLATQKLHYTIIADMEDFGSIQQKLDDLGIEPTSAQLQRMPTTLAQPSEGDAKKALHLVDLLEDDDDVQAIYHNLELTDELAAQLNAE